MKEGYFFGDSLADFANEEYDYLYTGIPDYEDLASFGVTTKVPESYKTKFLDQFFTQANPKLGTITIAFTGARRNGGRVLPKAYFLEQSLFEKGYYLRDLKHVKKSSSYNAYSHQVLNVYTFQKNGTKAIFNLQKARLYHEYGRDVWGPFEREKLIDGEVVGQPWEIPYYCIQNFTNEGHLVFDPFSGIATTLVAAKRLNRKYLGYEIRKAIYDVGVARLEATTLDPVFKIE